MIVDCYTHVWESATQLGRFGGGEWRGLKPPGPASQPVNAGPARHLAAAHPVTATIVIGFTSRYLEADLPNDRLAEYVRDHQDRLVGFAGIDPSEPKSAIAEIRRASGELGLRGIAVAPAAQDFHPTSSHAMRVYAVAAELGLPVVFHTGVRMTPATKMVYAQPILLDEIAREFSNMRIVVAHMGYPWTHEAILLVQKHPNVFAEISWLLHQPWEAYQALLSAHQHGVMDKLLFGSGFPYASASPCIESLYSINQFVHGTSLPTVPRESLRGIVERDALTLLGVRTSSKPAPAPALQDEDAEVLA